MSDLPARTPDHGSSASVDVDGDTSGNGSFLVHSQKTLMQDLPPKVDNKVLSRQRRRRTSPQDHSILEAEYQRNPKPDKTTRASIVSRVSLGDKEVQIWFQNRRQNDRRRSKPLPPHELPPSANGIITARISDERSTVNSGKQDSSPKCPSIPSSSQNTSFETCASSDPSDVISSSQPEASQSTVSTEKSDEGDTSSDNNGIVSSDPVSAADAPPSPAGKRKRSDSDLPVTFRSERRQTVGTFIPPSLRISLSFDGEAIVRGENEKTPSPQKPRDPVRISFSADGEAVVRTADEPSPCKDRVAVASARRAKFGTLRRCNSAVSLGRTSTGVSSLRERLFGRSRDSRAWELYCDTDARSALTSSQGEDAPAEARRKSDSTTAKPRTSRSSNTSQRPSGPPPQKRKKLSRTVSSLGRLESDSLYSTGPGNSKLEVFKDDDKDHEEYHAGDSDKENWIPGTQVSSVRRHKPTNPRRTAQGLSTKMSANSRQGAGNPQVLGRSRRPNGVRPSLPSGTKHASFLSEDENGPISKFMRGVGSKGQVEDDFDPVQGLLSLSQGAWR